MFDWGVLCSTESGVIIDSPVKLQVIEEFKKLKGYFVNPDEKEKLSEQCSTPMGRSIRIQLANRPLSSRRKQASMFRQIPPV